MEAAFKEAIALTLPTEAHLVQGYLESEGIECFLKDELTTQVNNFYSNAVGGVKVMVRKEDYEKALQLLEQGGYLHAEPEKKVEVVYRSATTPVEECPFCHSKHIGKKKVPDVLTGLISFFLSTMFGGIFPIFKRANTCYDCGKEWIYTSKKPAKKQT